MPMVINYFRTNRDHQLIDEACKISKDAEIVYLFAGLPDSYEAEGFDRENMSMPASHVELINAVSKVNDRVVVILQGGSPMEMVWADQVKGILLMYLAGEAGAGACADLLLGKVDPSGKLAESWPLTESDSPSHGNFPGYPLSVEYREGLFIGYRYYDKARKAIRYPFGYGLSYTNFAYSDMELSTNKMKDTETLTASCTISNIGKVTGSEVVQLYIACKGSVIIRPDQELKNFAKVCLNPGENCKVSFSLGKRDFAYFNTSISDWHVENGDYEVRISASSQDIRLTNVVHVESTTDAPPPDLRQIAPCYYDLTNGIKVQDEVFEKLIGRPIPPRERAKGSPHTIQSTLSEIQDNRIGRSMMKSMRKQMDKMGQGDPEFQKMAEQMIPDMPLRFLGMMSGGSLSLSRIEALVELMNGHYIRGLIMLGKKD